MVRIFKDAQPDDLVRQVGRIGRIIVASDAHEHEQPVLDGGHDSAVHSHTRRGHTLHDGSHREILATLRLTPLRRWSVQPCSQPSLRRDVHPAEPRHDIGA